MIHKMRENGVTAECDRIRARRTLKLVGNLYELRNCGVTQVTAQIRYPKNGEEVEQNIHLSVFGGEHLVRYRIFSTNIAGGYVYRLIFSHVEEGLLATPWSKRVNNDYIFASLPEDLQRDIFDDKRDDAVAAARVAMVTEAGDQLAKFDLLLAGN